MWRAAPARTLRPAAAAAFAMRTALRCDGATREGAREHLQGANCTSRCCTKRAAASSHPMRTPRLAKSTVFRPL